MLGASSWRAEPHHPRARRRVAGRGRAGQDAVLARRPAGTRARLRAAHRGARQRRIAEGRVDAARPARCAIRSTPAAAEALLAYVREQVEATGEVPSDRAIVVERFVDDVGDWRVVVCAPSARACSRPGRSPSPRACGRTTSRSTCTTPTTGWPSASRPATSRRRPRSFFPSPDDIEDMVTRALRRHGALRGALPRVRRRARCCCRGAIRGVARPSGPSASARAICSPRPRSTPSSPSCSRRTASACATRSTCRGSWRLLRDVQSRQIRVTTVDTRKPSPFAVERALRVRRELHLRGGRAARGATRAGARHRLRAGCASCSARPSCARCSTPRPSRSTSATSSACRARRRTPTPCTTCCSRSATFRPASCAPAARPGEADACGLPSCCTRGGVFEAPIAGQTRLAAVEDAAQPARRARRETSRRRFPRRSLEPSGGALRGLVARYARTHGPFVLDDVAARLGPRPRARSRPTSPRSCRGSPRRGRLPARRHRLRALRSRRPRRPPTQVARPAPAGHRARRRRARSRGFLPEWQGVPRRAPRDATRCSRWWGSSRGAPCSCPRSRRRSSRRASTATRAGTRRALRVRRGRVGGARDAGRERRAHRALPRRARAAARPSRGARRGPDGGDRARAARRAAAPSSSPTSCAAVGGFPNDVLEALWQMVWAGEVTNDTLEPLRSRARAAGERSSQRRRTRVIAPRTAHRSRRGSEGRWSLRAVAVAAQVLATPSGRSGPRARAARSLRRRDREAAHAEGVTGGFAAIYDVLKALEDRGRVRRGYFVEGRGGAQFALPGADERLRSHARRSTSTRRPWCSPRPIPPTPTARSSTGPPAKTDARPQRAAGALVVLQRRRAARLAGTRATTRCSRSCPTRSPPGAPQRARSPGRSPSGSIWRPSRAPHRDRSTAWKRGEALCAEHFVAAGFSATAQGLLRRGRALAERRGRRGGDLACVTRRCSRTSSGSSRGSPIVPKRRSGLQRAIAIALLVVTAATSALYLTRYHTVLFGQASTSPTRGTPWATTTGTSCSATSACTCASAAAWATSRWPIVYLVPIFPLFLAWGRARIEWEAYVETIRATAELRGLAAARRLKGDLVRAFRRARLRLDVAVPADHRALVRRGHRGSRGRSAGLSARPRLIPASRGRGLW